MKEQQQNINLGEFTTYSLNLFNFEAYKNQQKKDRKRKKYEAKLNFKSKRYNLNS